MLTNNDFKKIDNLIDEKNKSLKKDLVKSMKKEINLNNEVIIEKLNLIISTFDNNYLDHEKRIGRVERHLSLSSIQ